MVSAAANIKVSPVGLVLLLIVGVSFLLYFKDIFMNSAGLGQQLQDKSLTVSLKQLLIAAIEATERGGKRVKEIRDSNDVKETSKGKTLEGANDPLTEGDLQSHNAMYYSLKSKWHYLNIVSEERSKTGPDKLENPIDIEELLNKVGKKFYEETADIKVPVEDVLVWIDPLDATQEYTENLRQFVTTMVCVAVKGEPVIGVIHKPFLSATVWAWVGHGSSIQEEGDKEKQSVHSPVIIVSRSHKGEVSKIAKKAFGDAVKVVNAGGAGYKVLETVKKKSDLYLHVTKIKKWDICAGNAILNYFGGKMTDFKGNRIDYSSKTDIKVDGLLAALKDHDKYLEKLKQNR